MDKTAKFNIGDFVVHKRHGYRAIIVDVDPLFQASGRYNPQASKRDFAGRNPWYRLLVDDSSLETYVEECYLEPDSCHEKITNPKLRSYLTKKQGQYRSTSRRH